MERNFSILHDRKRHQYPRQRIKTEARYECEDLAAMGHQHVERKVYLGRNNSLLVVLPADCAQVKGLIRS